MAAAQKKGRKAARNVITQDGKLYLAGQEVPADVAETITNPKVWEKPEGAGGDADPSDDDD